MVSLMICLWWVRKEKSETATGTSSAAFIVLAGRSGAARLLGCVRWLRLTLAAAPKLATVLSAPCSFFPLSSRVIGAPELAAALSAAACPAWRSSSGKPARILQKVFKKSEALTRPMQITRKPCSCGQRAGPAVGLCRNKPWLLKTER